MTDIDAGRILIGGQDISRLRQADLRSLIAYVPQDPAMFHRTLRDNIAFARPDATEAEIRRAAEAAHVTEFADALPEGFDTMVGERGIKLSGGQRQRVALARRSCGTRRSCSSTRRPAPWTPRARSSSRRRCGGSWSGARRWWWPTG